MPIVGGLDIHRKQITFDYLDTGPGRCSAARSPRPTGSTCGPGWRGSPAARTSRSRSRGAPGGGMSPRSWPRPASRRIWPSRPTPRSPAAASGTPRPTRPTAGTCGCCWPRAGCRSAGSRPAASWNAGRCWRPTTTCGPSTPPGCSGSTRCLFHQGAPALGEGTLRTEQGLAALREASAACLSPAGQLQVATALEVLEALEARLHAVRHQLLDAARHLAGAKVLAARLYGVGPFTALAMTCWLGGEGRFSSSRQAVRFAGLDVTVCSSDRKGPPGRLSRQGPPVLRWAVYEAGKTHARSSAPDHALLRPGQGPLQRQARRAVRGPQDPPAGLPHPGRARRRRARRRLRPPTPCHGDQPVTAPAPAGPTAAELTRWGPPRPAPAEPLSAAAGPARRARRTA